METSNNQEKQPMTPPKDILAEKYAISRIVMQRLAEFNQTADATELLHQFNAGVIDEVSYNNRKEELFARYLGAHPVLVPA